MMKFDIARQSLLHSFPTLVLTVAAAFLSPGGSVLSTWSATVAAPLASLLGRMQIQWHTLSELLCVCLLVAAGLVVGRIGVRYALYGSKTCLPISLFGVVCCGLYLPADRPAFALGLLLFALSARNFAASLRNGYAFGQIFRASLYLGMLPLLHPAALPLLAAIVPLALILKRTLREFVVALFGALLPLAACSYLGWACGAPFTQTVAQLLASAFASPQPALLASLTPAGYALLGAVVFALLCSLVFLAVDSNTQGTKVRLLLAAQTVLLASTVALNLLPGAGTAILPLAAVPASILLPVMFVRIRNSFSLSLYLVLFVLFAAVRFGF